ncbi:MAG: DNA-binding protein, partial [Planctomycetes bacterium]|nr:DNA-binding protein [Planctomycetota bacterium]
MNEDHFQKLIQCLEWEAEEEAQELLRLLRHSNGSQAERTGVCLIGLTIRDERSGFGGRVVVTLGKRDQRADLPWSRLSIGTPVVLSEERSEESSAWRGVVTDRDHQTITVALTDSPEPQNDRPTFRLDLSSDEISRQRQRDALRKVQAADRGRLVVWKRCLLGETAPRFLPPISREIRSNDNDRLPADSNSNNEALPTSSYLEKTFDSQLDNSQREAIQHALSAQDVAIIHGPPGTGKTTAVVELIRQAICRGDRVLACAPSNLAVDNLLERLIAAGERAIRLGHPARVLPELRERTLDLQVESHPDLKLAAQWTKEAWSLRRQAGKFTRTAPAAGTRQELRSEAKQLLADAREMEDRLTRHLLESATVVCSTLTGLNADVLGDIEFDLVVIDEAAQTTEPPCWIPLLRSQCLVLAGDHCQLPATVTSNTAARNGFSLSLMERLIALYGDSIVRQLTTQFRMHEQIMQFSSDEFYRSTLIAHDSVRGHVLADRPGVTSNVATQTPVRFYDTAGSGCEEQAESEGTSLLNTGE